MAPHCRRAVRAADRVAHVAGGVEQTTGIGRSIPAGIVVAQIISLRGNGTAGVDEIHAAVAGVEDQNSVLSSEDGVAQGDVRGAVEIVVVMPPPPRRITSRTSQQLLEEFVPPRRDPGPPQVITGSVPVAAIRDLRPVGILVETFQSGRHFRG